MTPEPLVVGNDIVDLTATRTQGKAADERFLKRILDPVERDYVAQAEDADRALWATWASKEAVYKIASKLRPTPPTFEHATFGVRWDDANRSGATSDDPPASEGHDPLRTGSVRWQELEAIVLVTGTPGYIHAVAHARGAGVASPTGGDGSEAAVRTIGTGVGRLDDETSGWAGPLAELMRRFTPREAHAIHSHASAAVRLAARGDLARALEVEEARVEIICAPGVQGRRPPFVFLDGEPAPADVSLSHDGPWLAWAWRVSPRGADS